MKTGLASVSFRHLQPIEIIGLVKKAGLDGIEWGGDIHVPPGDLKYAGEILKMTRNEGLEVSSYGSYYRIGCGPENKAGFDSILETALKLDAPVIRVWAGNKASREAEEAYWERVIEDAGVISGMAQREGIQVALEYHEDTLTDTWESAVRLLKAVDGNNLKSYWQTHMEADPQTRQKGLRAIAPWLVQVHIFSWLDKQRAPLADTAREWQAYLNEIQQLDTVRYCLLEFVKDNSTEQFMRDAETLKQLLRAAAC